MTGEVHGHETTVSLVKAPVAELYAGSDMALKVRVSCPSSCDLRGSRVRLADEGALREEVELVSFDGAANETAEFILKAPAKPGEFTWAAVFAAQETAGLLHDESSAKFSFTVEPHMTSMAVWDVPSPIVFNTRFRIKVGVRCSTECKLTGKEVGIHDHQETTVTTVTLGDVPWSDAGALYWAEVELEAPDAVGYYTWEAKFPKPDQDPLHEGASHPFAFGTVRQPENVVTVEVLDKATNTPIEHADAILHPYRSRSDVHGVSRLMVPKGEYELYVSAAGMQTFQTAVKVDGDVAVRAELSVTVIPDIFG